jgi:hypothetical protein
LFLRTKSTLQTFPKAWTPSKSHNKKSKLLTEEVQRDKCTTVESTCVSTSSDTQPSELSKMRQRFLRWQNFVSIDLNKFSKKIISKWKTEPQNAIEQSALLNELLLSVFAIQYSWIQNIEALFYIFACFGFDWTYSKKHTAFWDKRTNLDK